MRISYFAATLTVCSPAMASNSGPYIGIGATHDNVATSGDLEGLGINGLGGTVVAGYDIPIGENAFLGVESNFDVLSAEAGDDDLGFKVKNSFGGSARLGFNVSDSISAYGRVATPIQGVIIEAICAKKGHKICIIYTTGWPTIFHLLSDEWKLSRRAAGNIAAFTLHLSRHFGRIVDLEGSFE